MTSCRTFRSWKHSLLRTALLPAIFVISTSGSPCTPEVICHPPSVQLANLSYPLRRLGVSSTCGAGNASAAYCWPADAACDADSARLCDGQHTADLMLDVTSSVPVNPDLITYWQSENSVSAAGTAPTTQYIEASCHTVKNWWLKQNWVPSMHVAICFERSQSVVTLWTCGQVGLKFERA